MMTEMTFRTAGEKMNEEWKAILEDYNEAKAALWGSKKANHWYRDEDAGLYHLWNAYYHAVSSDEKEPLLYARILYMMACESRGYYSEYEQYHKFIKPAMDSYNMAIKDGMKPTEKELEQIKSLEAIMAYNLECHKKPFEEHICHIEGHELLEDFEFHDSKPVWFEHTEDTARLTLKYGDLYVTFLFEDVIDVYAAGDPMVNYIMDFYCYPIYHNDKRLLFDVDFYRIYCSKVKVIEVKRDS